MDNNETGPYLIDVEAAKTLYKDLRERIEEGSTPTVTASDNGKILRVVNGEWTAVELQSATGVNF